VAKAGIIDDPVWREKPSTVTSGAFGSERKRHRWVSSTVVAFVIAVGMWLLLARLDGSGDPGGKILLQLSPTASALPGYGTSSLPWSTQPSTSHPYLIKSEPHRDSCDGISDTQGWSQVVVQGSIRWTGSHTALLEKVGSGLSAMGWRPTQNTSPNEAVWTKSLDNGSTARAMLTLSPLGNPDWEFVALAPPAGKPASGC
jgi:hypothetical protein